MLEAVVNGIAATLGRNHPEALTALTNLGAAELELACALESPERIERSARLLGEVASRLAAVHGSDHPATVTGRVNQVLGAMECFRARRSKRAFEVATAQLARETRSMAAAVGERHPASVLALANLATAQLDVARSQPTDARITESGMQAIHTLEGGGDPGLAGPRGLPSRNGSRSARTRSRPRAAAQCRERAGRRETGDLDPACDARRLDVRLAVPAVRLGGGARRHHDVRCSQTRRPRPLRR